MLLAPAPSPELAARLRAYVRGRVADAHAAEDIAQEVLLRVHRHGGRLRDPGALEGWAHRVARNAIVDHARAARPEVPVDGERLAAVADDPGVEDDEVLAHLTACVPALLAELAPADREALELCDLGGMTQAEAAERLGLTVPGMKARVQRARRRLRALVVACCEVVLDARNHPVELRPTPDCRCGR